MDAGAPKFRRRKADRPAEIVSAALAVFAEKGFAAAKLEEIARRAGVSKGAVYLYFETKEDIFHAVIDRVLAPNVSMVKAMIASHPGPISDLLRAVAAHIPRILETVPVGGVAKMVIGEARNFPELARLWHDELVAHVLGALTAAIGAAQARGEVKAGEPRIYALQLIAPILTAVIWRETFTPVGAEPFELSEILRQHVDTLLDGMLVQGARS